MKTRISNSELSPSLTRIGLALSFLLLISPSLPAQEVSQWRGPARDGIYPGENLMKEWPEDGPEKLWVNEEIGVGFSSAVTVGGVIYVTGKRDSIEYLSALNPEGELIWQLPYGLAPHRTYPDTRGTVTVEGNKAWMISGRGQVVCVDLLKPEVIWSVEAYEKYKGESGSWEIAESPLIVDDKVIFTPAGSLTTMIALDKNTGKEAWKTRSLKDTMAYVSPLVFELGGRKIIASAVSKFIFGVDASKGEILWTYQYSSRSYPGFSRSHFINANTPIYRDGKLFITSGYNHTSVMLALSEEGTEVEEVWKQPVLDTHHGGVVLVDGHIYGSTWINNRSGNWVSVDWETGELNYEEEWVGKGPIIYADGMLILYEERTGQVGLVEPTPDAFRLISSFKHEEGSGPHWSHPSISNGILLIRHGKALTAYRIGN